MLVTLFGIVILVRALHPLNIELPILGRLFGKVTLDKLEQLLNALGPYL